MAVVYDIKAVFSKQSFAHVGIERQTNIHTNTHFLEAISVNQAHAHSWSSVSCTAPYTLRIYSKHSSSSSDSKNSSS